MKNILRALIFSGLSLVLVACSQETKEVTPASSKQTQATSSSVQVASSTPVTTSQEPVFEKAGEFVSVNHPTAGRVTMKQVDGVYHVFLEGMTTDEGPDLKLVVSTQSGENWKENYQVISDFHMIQGDSAYALPVELDPNSIQTVLIWCEEHDSLYGFATLA